MRKYFSNLNQRFHGWLAGYYFKVLRVEHLSGANIPTLEESKEMLEPHGLKIGSAALCHELFLLALGADVKNRHEVNANIRFELNKRCQWWMKPLMPYLEKRLLNAHMNDWFILGMLENLHLPGNNAKRKYVSAAVLFLCAKVALRKYQVPLSDIEGWLKRVSHLAKSATENEQVLLSALPSDAQMAELPKMLQEQFDDSDEDPDFFFSGPEYEVAYAVAKAVRQIKSAQKKSKDKKGDHVYLLEKMMSEPGRAIIMETSRQLEKFRAFVLVKLKEFTPDPNGDEVRMRAIDNVTEIGKARVSSLAMLGVYPDLFWRKVVNREIRVKEYGFIEQERPRAHLLIDKSPSMLFFGKLFKAGGVLFNRLLLILSDEADVVFQLFDEKLHKEVSIDGPFEAEQVMTLLKRKNFIGSGTNIQNALEKTIARVAKLPSRKIPDHVILVSDGDSEVTLVPEDFENIRLHCFILKGTNEALKAISMATGGVYQET